MALESLTSKIEQLQNKTLNDLDALKNKIQSLRETNHLKLNDKEQQLKIKADEACKLKQENEKLKRENKKLKLEVEVAYMVIRKYENQKNEKERLTIEVDERCVLKQENVADTLKQENIKRQIKEQHLPSTSKQIINPTVDQSEDITRLKNATQDPESNSNIACDFTKDAQQLKSCPTVVEQLSSKVAAILYRTEILLEEKKRNTVDQLELILNENYKSQLKCYEIQYKEIEANMNNALELLFNEIKAFKENNILNVISTPIKKIKIESPNLRTSEVIYISDDSMDSENSLDF